jgi:hypothetical protein
MSIYLSKTEVAHVHEYAELNYIRKVRSGHMMFPKTDCLFQKPQKPLNVGRRDWDVMNSIIITWLISFTHISQTRSSAADLLSLTSSFDRQSALESRLRSGMNTETLDNAKTSKTAVVRMVPRGMNHHRQYRRWVWSQRSGFTKLLFHSSQRAVDKLWDLKANVACYEKVIKKDRCLTGTVETTVHQNP